MSSGIFIINDRFRIYPALNQLQDMQTGNLIRLEPRIMAVLEHLSRYAGQLVSREELIHDIWKNYGGGDEGLSQAISFLRKMLGDREKSLIQTIPKKGYCLNAVLRVDEVEQQKDKPVIVLPSMRSLARYSVLFYVLGTAFYFVYNGLNLQPTAVGQNISLVTRSASVSPCVQPAVKKILPVVANNKTTPIAIRLKGIKTTACNEKLRAPSSNPLPILSANTETKSYHYHLSDKTSQIVTTLDYQVAITLVSTIIN
jgi:DNA-binding winged helix-turn-helix (wHTH) protein